MATPKKPSTSERDWWAGAWEWVAEKATTTGCGVRVVLTPHSKQGVWRVRLQVVELVDGRVKAVVAECDELWPGRGPDSLGAQVINQTIRLDQAVVGEAEGLLRDL